MTADSVLDRMVSFARTRLPDDITPSYFDGFVERNRAELRRLVGLALERRRDRREEPPPDAWSPAQRTAANLAAMQVAASKAPEHMTAADLAVLGRYSGWGGLSIRGAADRFPDGFPIPEERGLIHEYYTPTAVAREVARLVRTTASSLPTVQGHVLALEPSAGIGRFVQALRGPGFEALRWSAVEWSELSSRMLQAMRPDLRVFQGPFEQWVREHGAEVSGRLGLIVSNPPYGTRGLAVAEDPDRTYREKNAYAYFLRRGLDLLAPGGLGVFLVPAGFLSGRSAGLRSLREGVLRRHHLAAAFRLPSGLFPGAMLVTDLLFLRARGGELAAVDEADRVIADGEYFDEYPGHILGEEVGKPGDDEDQTARPRWGYQVRGTFSRLPDLVERPVCAMCAVVPLAPVVAAQGRTGVARQLDEATQGLSAPVADAVRLGVRVDRYLSAVAAEETNEPIQLWPELHDALTAWTASHGNPWAHVELRQAAQGHDAIGRFLAAFTRAGGLIEGINRRPTWAPRYAGRPDDIVAVAEWAYRTHRGLTRSTLAAEVARLGARMPGLHELLDAGWCADGNELDLLMPETDYLTGQLWPRYDRLREMIDRGASEVHGLPLERIELQARRLLQTIKPAVFDDIGGVSPRQGWVPIDLIGAWMTEVLNRGEAIQLERHAGLVQIVGGRYEDMESSWSLSTTSIWCIGWMNHDRSVFSPTHRKDQPIDEVRLKLAEEWDRSFRVWVSAAPERAARVETVYNRAFRGYVAPTYTAEPMPIARWTRDGVQLHPHQVAGARRVLANRGGMLAFDVGVGKTYTGIAVVAAARQEGWCRRPVILVPNSIVWKWEADIQRVLPDYRVAVIGSNRKVVARGDRKGFVTSETDSPTERAQKWTRFQAGEFDVVLLTYTALGRTRMNLGVVQSYADATEAIRREVRLRQRNASEARKLTERQQAILREGTGAWVAEQLEIAEGWEYDPGVAWDDIGVDLLVVDEAQNYKNLYLPEPREGGVPRFMGNAGEGSKRAWQLDFRCAAVRQRTGGTGIVLLSATPAKNSPLEFYNLIQLIDHDAWARLGISDPEQFIDRYLRIEMKPVIDSKMEVVDRGAVTGFQNLHELRDVIFRYGEFKTAEDVGLKLPEPQVRMVEVDMNAAQAAKYDKYVGEIERALQSTDKSDKAQILGLLARMALVAIHPNLDEGYDWKTAGSSGVVPESPKFSALAERVAENRACGHIVFCDNVAAHRWVFQTLVRAGISESRIAVLNAETAKAAADRQRIAVEFNGDPAAGVAPRYDVVIANAIAYEGIDLQTRTCAIHHLDLPWEPATLQQRNGRGVRQGNTLAAISINYYFARRSQDGLRFNLIQGKLGWMTELIRSTKRDTNNPGAQMEMGQDEVLLLISRDPEKTAKRLAEVRARREAEARQRVSRDASRALRAVNALFRRAERVADVVQAASMRADAEERLNDLGRVDPAAWPWARLAYAVREASVYADEDGGCPLFEGLRIGIPSALDPSVVQHAEIGRVRGTDVGVLNQATQQWHVQPVNKVIAQIRPEHLNPVWPAADAPVPLELARWWPQMNWTMASDGWVSAAWEVHGARVIQLMASVSTWSGNDQRVPVVHNEQLAIASGAALAKADVLPPTAAGWNRFLGLAAEAQARGDWTWTQLNAAAAWWWGRAYPKGAA